MAGTGSYISGSASADYYFTAGELLSKLPDNTANLIKAKDVRDSVWTLWNRVDDISIIAASAASASAYFQNPNPTPITVGGIPSGSTFATPQDMQTMWNKLLYPYIAPGASITGGGSREYGSTLSVTLNWSVVKNSDPITSITVDGSVVIPTGNNQSGVKVSSGTHSVSPGLSQTNTFSIVTSDGTSVTNASTTLTWMNRIYWGSLNVPGNPNLTLNPSLSAAVSALITSSTLTSLSGAGVGTGSQLATTKTKSYDNINGGGNFLIFAWPTIFSGSTTPAFKVNGLTSTAFTQVKTSWLFTNQFGFSSNYEVWVSNTIQNSPLFIEIS